MRVFLVEPDARDYLIIRRLLDEQTGKFSVDWAPSYEIALTKLKRANSHDYDVYLIGYYAANPGQEALITWVQEHTSVPMILLTKSDKLAEDSPIWQGFKHKPVEDYPLQQALCKNRLTWPQLERSICYVSSLMSLRQSEQKFYTIFNQAVEFIGLLKPNGIVVEMNQTALTLSGFTHETLNGQLLWNMPNLSSPMQEPVKLAVTTAAQGETTQCTVLIRTNTTLNLSLLPVTNTQSEIVWILAEGQDVSDYQRMEEELRHATLHDPLTGLPNRQSFIEHLERAITHAQQHSTHRLALLLIDLDRFKMINESLGHDMGDWLLMEVAQRLQECLTPKQLLARSGGDEFMILMDDFQDLKEAMQLATQINKALSPPFLLDGCEVITSASIGIAYNTSQSDSAELLRHADTAMYRAKAMGKSCYVVFNNRMQSKAISRLQIESDLYRALEKRQFVLFFQPQTELFSERLVGAEALIRFQHPQHGLLSPLHFMSILEDTGIIIPLGEWILRTACQQLKMWLQEGLPLDHIAVNLSAQQFLSKRLPDTVAEAIKNARLDPDSLILELTESLLLEDTQSAMRTLARFKETGVRVAIDDFGTGYASLSYLKRFPADCLKIDKSFIDGVISTPADAAITVATIDMAHALGLSVTAEGVETTDQRDFLRDHGCDVAQGYLYAPPMAGPAFFKWAQQYSKMISHRDLLPK